MATCKDCIHHDICDAKGNLILTINDICELEYRTDVSKWWCKQFEPTADVAPKSEVIKEFAERLKKYYSHLDGKSPTPLIVYHIDQIEKEMLEEKI